MATNATTGKSYTQTYRNIPIDQWPFSVSLSKQAQNVVDSVRLRIPRTHEHHTKFNILSKAASALTPGEGPDDYKLYADTVRVICEGAVYLIGLIRDEYGEHDSFHHIRTRLDSAQSALEAMKVEASNMVGEAFHDMQVDHTLFNTPSVANANNGPAR
jgi:hypothetical protein